MELIPSFYTSTQGPYGWLNSCSYSDTNTVVPSAHSGLWPFHLPQTARLSTVKVKIAKVPGMGEDNSLEV